MSDDDSSRRAVLKRGALFAGALVPAALARTDAAAAATPGRGPFDVRDFGARGDGETFDTAALQAAIDACHGAGGGTVLVPAGTWLTAAFALRSRVRGSGPRRSPAPGA